MASMVIVCDRCGKELDTRQRMEGAALKVATQAGWRVGRRELLPPSPNRSNTVSTVPLWRESRERGDDLCADCVADNHVSAPNPTSERTG
jgi:hypothetical protein